MKKLGTAAAAGPSVVGPAIAWMGAVLVAPGVGVACGSIDPVRRSVFGACACRRGGAGLRSPRGLATAVGAVAVGAAVVAGSGAGAAGASAAGAAGAGSAGAGAAGSVGAGVVVGDGSGVAAVGVAVTVAVGVSSCASARPLHMPVHSATRTMIGTRMRRVFGPGIRFR